MNKRMPRILILIAILNQLHGQGGGQGYGDMVIMGIPFTHTDSLLAESHDNWDFTNYNLTGANSQDYAFTLNVYDTLRLDISVCDPITNFDSMLGVFRRTVNDTFIDSSLTCIYPEAGQGYSLIDCFAEDSHACTPAIGGEDQPPTTPDLKSVIYGYELTPDITFWLDIASGDGTENMFGIAHVDTAVIPSSGDFSVSVWCAADDGIPDNTKVLSQPAGIDGTEFSIGPIEGDSTIWITDEWDTGIDFTNDENWHLYTVTKSATNTKLYLDGVLVAERGSAIGNPAGQPFYLGVGADGDSQYLNGWIEKVAVWDVELSASAIAGFYTWGGPPWYLGPFPTLDLGDYTSSADLIGYWNFDDSTGNQSPDLSGNSKPVELSPDARHKRPGNYIEPVTYYIVVDSYLPAGNDPPNRFRINVTHHVPPFITGFDLAEDNSYVDITFNKNTYTFDEPWEEGDHSLLIEDFEPSNFQANGGVANPPVINSITNTDGESLQGGEPTVRLSLELNPASGVETFEIKPATSTSIYDGGGTPMADTTNTGEITLNGVAVTIIDAILEDDNSYITITFNDTVYSDQATTASLNIDDFERIFNQNAGDGGTATDVTIESVTSNDGDPLTGGVDIIRIYLSEIDPPPSGAEHILIKPKDNSSIYNKVGVAMPETQTSGEIYLKDKLAPTILTTNLEPSNFISITASERLYKDETGEDEVDQNNFECIIDISAEGSNAETVTINSVVTPDEVSVQYLYNLNLTVNPLPSGVETVYVRPRLDNPIYDGNGNVMSDSTAILTLNDKIPPSLNTASIDESNSFVILTFTEGLYTDTNGNNPVIPNDFTANISIPDNATTASISGLSDLSGAALVGGETLIKLIVVYDQPASGQESMEIKPQENQVFDNAGNAVIGIENDTTFRLNDVLGPSVLFEPGNNSEIHPYNDIFTLTFTEQVRLRLTNENVTNDDILNLITVAYIDGNEETIGFVPDKENDSTFTLDPDTLDQLRHLRVSVQDSVLEDTLDNPVVNQSAIYTVRDITPPVINTELSLINNSNTFVILSFSEGVYSNKDENNDGTGPLQPSDLILVFNPGVDDSVTSIEISDLQRPGGGSLSEGEDSIWVLIETIGTPNGNETFTIEPNPNDAIYDSSGNQLSPALPPLFSNISEISLNPYPWLDTYSLNDNNGYIDLIFSEAVYSSSDTLSAVEPNDFEVEFYPNFPSGGHATDATIDSLTKTNDDPLSGGESEIRVIISISNPPASGYETIVIKPITDFSICNYLGNRLSLSDSTDEITLIDHLAPTITAVSITNTTIVGNSLHGDIEFIASEGIFSNASGTGSINAENFNLAFYQNNGNATDAIIGEVSNFYQGDLTGGEDTVLIGFETERLPSGTEEFAISPATSNSIFDPAGNPMTQTTISERLTLPDRLPPEFVPGSASISSDNSYVIFTLTEGVYGNWETTTPAEPNDFFVEFIPNGGSATGANVAYITNSRQFPLVGGEDTLRCYLDIQGTPSGHERLYIRRDINSTVFDGSGNPLPVNDSIWFPDKATDTLQLFDQYHPRASVDTTFIRNRSHISSSIESPINILFNEPIQSFEYTISARHYNYITYIAETTATSFKITLQPPMASLDTITLSIFNLTDSAGLTEVTRYFDFYTPPLGDYNIDGEYDYKVNVEDLAQFVLFWMADSQPTILGLGPTSGTFPHLVPELDANYDLDDGMTFIRMWSWSLEKWGLEPLVASNIGTEINWDKLVVDVPIEAIAGQVYLRYDPNQGKVDLQHSAFGNNNFTLKKELADHGEVLLEFGLVEPNNDTKIISIKSEIDEPAEATVIYKFFAKDRSLIAAGTQKISLVVPTEFRLMQNYPNPFNNTTTIRYAVPEETDIKLEIFDISGRLVETLTSQLHQPGFYDLKWSGREAASGIYFIKLEAAKTVLTQKMILLK